MSHTSFHRVSYSETDQMQFMHHSNYLKMYENARWELFRELGISYKSIENENIIMPVIDVQMQFLKPAFYDDLLSVKTKISEIKASKIYFEYLTYNQHGILINNCKITIATVNAKHKTPTRVPVYISNLINPTLPVHS